MNDVSLSKFLSLVLRHEPQRIGLTLDEAGWVSVDALLAASQARGKPFSLTDLQRIVATSDKNRFAFNSAATHVHANQGHSVVVDLGYETCIPLPQLFHGTATRFLDTIRVQGLLKQARHHVHLSADSATATAVGQRHGKPAILKVRATDMHREGHLFYLSNNGVWLTDQVPPNFLEFPD